MNKETEQYFRAVDRAVLEHHSRPSGAPLLLAALAEHHSFFRRISRNGFLLDDIAEIVLKNRGQVVIVPTGRMPAQSGIAAMYRY